MHRETFIAKLTEIRHTVDQCSPNFRPASTTNSRLTFIGRAELNITSETLSRMLVGLRGKQLIRTSGKTILVLNPRRLETFMREFLGEALEQVPRIIESCCLGLGAFQLLARPEKFEVNLRAGNAPFEQIMINAHHKRFWPAEVIVRVAFWQHIFE